MLPFPVDRDTHDFLPPSKSCSFINVYLREESLPHIFVCHGTVSMAAFYQLKIKYDQDKFDADYLDAWPLFI